MAKPKPKRIPSDDCVLLIDGEAYHVHEGEWVEMYRGQTVGEMETIARLNRTGVEIQALQGESDANLRAVELLAPAFDALCCHIAKRLVDWNWTDQAGRPLPKPDGTPSPLSGLQADELMWLLTCASGEIPGERKNGLPPSPTT